MTDLHVLAASLPEYTDNPIDRLAHTLAAYPDRKDDDWAFIATQNVLPDHRVTGITWGDLRSLLKTLQGAK